LPKNKYLEGKIIRNRNGLNTFFPEYKIIIDETNIIFAKKSMAGYDILMGD
jgi:hypothetical protein